MTRFRRARFCVPSSNRRARKSVVYKRCRAPFKPDLYYLLASGACAVGLVGTPRVHADDLATISDRVTADLLSSLPSLSSVQGYLSSQQSNGSWSDITYTSTAATNWSPLTHLQRMQAMAQLYASPGSSLFHSPSVATGLAKAMDYWVTANPQSTNWFPNDISGPQALGAAMVLAKPVFSAAEIASGQTILARSKAAIPTYTGQNVVDLSIPGVYSAIVSGSATAMTSAFNSMNGTVFVSNFGTDGIQADSTYHIHNVQLYMGGYGTSYINDMLQWSSLSAGTGYALTDTQHHTLVNYLLDGTQWFIRGQTLDMAANGRQVTFPSYVGAGDGYSTAINHAMQLGNYRTAELQAFLARQQATIATGAASATASPLVGNRAFFNSDAMTHQRPGYYGSVKVTSTRTSNPESGNSQGLKNLYLGDGVNQISVTGNEYLGIQPVWNWYRLPGTTVEQDGRSLKPATDWGVVHGTTAYAGGVSDGLYGAEAFDYARYDVAAKKSWFFFDNEQVALGAAIKSASTSYDVNTTINQCLQNGAVSYETTASPTVQTFSVGSVTPTGLKWVYHGGIGYFFISPVNEATIQVAAQSGTWASLNTAASSSTVTANVFTLLLNHGRAVSNGTYGYIAVPGLTLGQMDAYLAGNPITVLRNDSVAQAVRQATLNLVQAAFYSSGTVSIAPTQTLAVSTPAAVLLQTQPNTLKLTIASPKALSGAANVTLDHVMFAGGTSWFDALGTGTAAFTLPGGNLAGSSVGLTLACDGQPSPTVSLTSTAGSAPSKYTVTGPVTLPGPTALRQDALTTLAFSNVISGSGALTKTGLGTLALSAANTLTGGITVGEGTLALGPAAQPVTIAGPGGVDVGGGRLTLSYAGNASPAAMVQAILAAAYAGQFASGTIRATTLGAGQTLGFADDGASTITILATLPGDADLNGVVNFSDFLALQNSFGLASARFDRGDFDYNGKVDFNDFLLLQNNFGQSLSGAAVGVTAQQVATLTAFGRAHAVPEPMIVAPAVAAALWLRRRSRFLDSRTRRNCPELS